MHRLLWKHPGSCPVDSLMSAYVELLASQQNNIESGTFGMPTKPVTAVGDDGA